MTEEARIRGRRLAREALARGDASGWFEQLYAQADGDPRLVQWADMEPNPALVRWLQRGNRPGGASALVVGCGLGDDAEALSRHGYRVLAFDIAPTAVSWCRQRFAVTDVEYMVADLLHPPVAWAGSFDLVVEIYTLQVLPPPLRRLAIERLSGFLAPGGTLFVFCRGRDPQDDTGEMPWPLLREELDRFRDLGLAEITFEDFVDAGGTRRFCAEYRASGSSGAAGG